MVVKVSCQTQRLLEPRPQEQHHQSSPRQPAAALDSSEAAAPRPLVTAVPAAAAAAPKLAVKAAPTAAPVLKQERKIITGTIIKKKKYRSFTVLTNT
jgi:hypothetical protein